MQEITNLSEFKRNVIDQNYIYCSLIDQNGKKLINRNKKKTDFDSNLDKIIKKLQSNFLKNGSYFIECAVHPYGETESWLFNKGGVKTIAEGQTSPTVTIIEREKPSKSPEVLTYAKALEYQNEINRLTYENKRLEEENKALREELEEFEEEEEENEEERSIAENNPVKSIGSIIENILATAMPVLDRHYTIKEKQLEIDRLKYLGATEEKQAPKVTPQEEQVLTNKINAWLEKISAENEELYNKLESLTAQVRSLEEWLVLVKTNFPDKYSELENFVTQN